jgi:Na+-driven multidrug efflux pump
MWFIGIEKSSYSLYFLIFDIIMSLVLMFFFSDVFNWGGFGVVFSVVFSEAIQGVLMFFVLRFKINLQIKNSSSENAV